MSLLFFFQPLAGIAAPVNTALPVITGTVRQGATLVASSGAWTNAPSSFGYQWQSAATVGGAYTNIGGATGQTYVPVVGDVGRFLRVVVTATNAGGSTAATAAPVGPVTVAIVVKSNYAAAWPTLIAELDFVGGATGSGSVWTDVSAYIRGSVSTNRGRANPLDRVEAGQASAQADNGDRRFEPEYALSPYYPNVLPRVGFRLRAAYNGTIYPLHRGYVDGWPISWPAVKRSYAAISSNDAFAILAGAKVTPQIFPLDLSGSQIATFFAQAQFPSALTLFDVGKETLLGVDATTDFSNPPDALSLAQDSADSELGLLFMGPDGVAVFHDRDHRISAARSTTTQATFSDNPTTGLPYVAPEPDFDVARVWNDVRVSSGLQDALPQVATDAASARQYGPRTLSRSTRLASDSQARDQAARILRDSKDPHLRFPTITIDPTRDARLWPVVLGLEISDRVAVLRTPYASATTISKLCWVEAIQHAITYSPERVAWTTTISLSLADPSTYLTLNDPVKGVLDSVNALR